MSAARRLGVILPDDGPDDYEWYALDAWLARRGADDVELRVAGSPADSLHVESSLYETGDPARLAPIAKQLAAEGCAAIVWACTSGSFIGGLDWARGQVAALARDTRLPVTSTSIAIPAALAALGAETVDLLSPYPPQVTRRLLVFLAEAGVGVAEVRSLDCLRATDSHGIDLEAEVDAFGPGSGHPLLVPDTAVNSLARIDALEDLAARPVLTANQVSLWHGLALLGPAPVLPEAGTLFRPRRRSPTPP